MDDGRGQDAKSRNPTTTGGAAPEQGDILPFIRRRDYVFVRELGQGACGRTVLLRDDLINEQFVCKKYSPYDENRRPDLYQNFVREVKMLHRLYHENVVRVFNYYLYPDRFSGYILMEFINGSDVEGYLATNPERVNEVFLQAVAGFGHLEANGILHRDIRPQNVLVGADDVVKIIDFGFGKAIEKPEDFEKSVSLNWWCDPPVDFSSDVYNFSTEVYFVGKLFERIIRDNGLGQFKYTAMLERMCQRDLADRVATFSEIQRHLESDRFFEIAFTEDETASYRWFADQLEACLSRIENNTKYQEDLGKAIAAVDDAYRGFMLEEFVPDSATVISCFVRGAYRYKKKGLQVAAVKAFLQIIKSASPEKRRIIIANLYTRLDAIERYCLLPDDEIPF
ncbi:MAG: protein kinase family protein [Actinobacteria bacterium]|nr:protein kinase family protein [Actinomycetota bacterium]